MVRQRALHCRRREPGWQGRPPRRRGRRSRGRRDREDLPRDGHRPRLRGRLERDRGDVRLPLRRLRRIRGGRERRRLRRHRRRRAQLQRGGFQGGTRLHLPRDGLERRDDTRVDERPYRPRERGIRHVRRRGGRHERRRVRRRPRRRAVRLGERGAGLPVPRLRVGPRLDARLDSGGRRLDAVWRRRRLARRPERRWAPRRGSSVAIFARAAIVRRALRTRRGFRGCRS